jgi:CheY-like chemotaxis protein
VDDNAILRTLLTHVLEANGFVALSASSAEEALEVARLAPPDLCLVDFCMPGVNGAELIRRLRSGKDGLGQVPAIGLSGYDGSEKELLAAGAVSALRKPCAEKALIDSVRGALARSALN